MWCLPSPLLSSPPRPQAEYLQYDLDGNDINGAKQSAGEVIGKFIVTDDAPSADALQPFQDAFGLQVLEGGGVPFTELLPSLLTLHVL